jgi:DNA relaxase NicK
VHTDNKYNGDSADLQHRFSQIRGKELQTIPTDTGAATAATSPRRSKASRPTSAGAFFRNPKSTPIALDHSQNAPERAECGPGSKESATKQSRAEGASLAVAVVYDRRRKPLPPASNRGVVKHPEHYAKPAKSHMKTYASVDWLRVTNRVHKNIAEKMLIRLRQDLIGHAEKRKGSYGYLEAEDLAEYGRIMSRTCPDDDGFVDICVDLTGQAMTVLRSSGWTDQRLCKYFESWNATRIDLAIDTTAERITPRFVRKQFRDKENRVCPTNTISFVAKESDGERLGETLYIGSRSSSRFMRVYDKVAEKLAKTGDKLIDDFGNEIEHLTRFELECKQEAAQHALEMVAASGHEAIKGIFVGWLDFRCGDNTRKTNKRRALWWDRIIGGAVALKPGLDHASTPEKTMRWLRNTVATSIRMAEEFLPEKLRDAINNCEPTEARRRRWRMYADKVKASA